MEKLTKEQRHKIYVKALRLYKMATEHPGNIYSLCFAINDVVGHNRLDRNAIVSPKQYPEIYKHRPTEYDLFWWPIENTEIRIKVLEQAIEETKPTKKPKQIKT